jgi:hypothetical protein
LRIRLGAFGGWAGRLCAQRLLPRKGDGNGK